MSLPPVIIAIPARNEASQIGACLAAIASQPGARQHIAGCAIHANNCTDDTAAIARAVDLPFALHVLETELPPEKAHIGHARRGATEAALALMHSMGLPNAIIAGTDADSRVAPDWLAALRSEFANDADAVCGAIDLDGAISANLAAVMAAETGYADAVARVADWLDPLPHDRWPNHIWCWGANLAVRAETLVAAGGSPIVDLAEDRALHAALLKNDARVRHSQTTRVKTSARTVGRAPGGFADLISQYADNPDALADYFLEPAAVTWRRAAQCGRARRRWQGGAGFGAHWAAIEAGTPQLARQRIAIAALAAETEQLNFWLAAAGYRADIAGSVAEPASRYRARAPQ